MSDLLKFITCGSVDDGKSTLIGHMLYDAKLLYADQKRALELDSKVGSRGGEIDYSLLLDGLMAEREQGITIDVAYRYFNTERRSFIVADTPGHEEYTRNMAVGASFADLAVILLDATKGVLEQTRRHVRICSLMGIRYFVFAVNKMDLVNYDMQHFNEIEQEIRFLTTGLELREIVIIPVSATEGDNVNKHSEAMPWYKGRPLLEYLEIVDIDEQQEVGALLPVQRVCRPDRSFRGFQGELVCGELSLNEEITVLPRGEKARIASLLWADRQVGAISAKEPVTVQLDREIDVSRGSVIVKDTELHVSNLFQATLLWMDDRELVEGHGFLLKLGTMVVSATVLRIKNKIDIHTGKMLPTQRIYKNELVVADISTAEKIVFDRFVVHRAMGRFILIDRVTNMTSACGVVEHELRRADNLFWQKFAVDREVRSQKLGQKPMTLWFTGLSGSGKSTLANELEKQLVMAGKHAMLLDGDNVRMGLNNNLGFTEKDRIENIRRLAEVAKLMNDAGLIVLVSAISPYRSDRRRAREIIGEGNFVEIYVSTPLAECEQRDVKGLYQKARCGVIPNFTGISSPYEVPEKAEIVIDTSKVSSGESGERLFGELKRYLNGD